MPTRRDFLTTRGAGTAAGSRSGRPARTPGPVPAPPPGAFTAPADVGYRGWVNVELDAVPGPVGSANASMLLSKRYFEHVLKLPL